MSTVGPGLSSSNILPANAKRERRRRRDVDIFDFRDSDLAAYEDRERGRNCSLPGLSDLSQREPGGTPLLGADNDDLHVSRLLLPADFSYPPPFAKNPALGSDQTLNVGQRRRSTDALRRKSGDKILEKEPFESMPLTSENRQSSKRDANEANLCTRDVRSLKKRILSGWIMSQAEDEGEAPKLSSPKPSPSLLSRDSHERVPRRQDQRFDDWFDDASCEGNECSACFQEGARRHGIPGDELDSSPNPTKQVISYSAMKSCVRTGPSVGLDEVVVASQITDSPIVGSDSEMSPRAVRPMVLSPFRVDESRSDPESRSAVDPSGDYNNGSLPYRPCARADFQSGSSTQSGFPSEIPLARKGAFSKQEFLSNDEPVCQIVNHDGDSFGTSALCENLNAELSQVVSVKALKSPKSSDDSAQASPMRISISRERKRSQIERRYNMVKQFEVQKVSGGAQQKEHVKMNLRGRTKLELWLAHAPPETLRAVEVIVNVLRLDERITSKQDATRRSALHAMTNEDLRACEALMIRIASRDGKANWRLLFKLHDELTLQARQADQAI